MCIIRGKNKTKTKDCLRKVWFSFLNKIVCTVDRLSPQDVNSSDLADPVQDVVMSLFLHVDNDGLCCWTLGSCHSSICFSGGPA